MREAAKDLVRPIYYTCGAPTFVVAMLRLLADMQVPDSDIQLEAFRGYA